MNPEPQSLFTLREKRLSGRRKAVTIGVGFSCSDGVVLCADRQITGEGYKFEESKIFSIQRNDYYTFIFSYAGDPDAARVMFEKTRDGMREITSSNDMSVKDRVKRALEQIFTDKSTKGLQTLIGVVSGGEHFLIKTKEKMVVEGFTEYIGAGDSSALRYLCGFLLHHHLTVSEALIFGSYIVSVAGRYVEFCSEGCDHATLYTVGGLVRGSGGPWPNQRDRFLHCEQEIGKGLRELLFSGGTKRIEVTDPKK